MPSCMHAGASVLESVSDTVAAPAHVVWSLLSNVALWPTWNHAVEWVEFAGPLAPGTTFRWKAQGVVIQSTLVDVLLMQRLAWTGRAMGVRAVHVWELGEEQMRAGERWTQVRCVESLHGPLTRVLARPLRGFLRNTLARDVQILRNAAEGDRSDA